MSSTKSASPALGRSLRVVWFAVLAAAAVTSVVLLKGGNAKARALPSLSSARATVALPALDREVARLAEQARSGR